MNDSPSAFPLRLGTPDDFSRIREALGASGFDETTLCRELKIPDLSSLGEVRWKELDFTSRPERLQRCVSLFLFGERSPRAALEKVFEPQTIAAFLALGLLRVSVVDPAALVSPIFLYPVAGFWVASDRHDDPDGQAGVPLEAAPDVVFPAIFGGTLRFLRLLPEVAGGDALDLCGGSGIGALCLGCAARTAVTADITERATRFAEFNARLNGCANVEVGCGDLYAAVAGRQFDCITAHPPYVPSLGSQMIYRDGGAVGEDITHGIVAGLPRYLRPGGVAMVLGLGRDAEDGPFEQRVRGWLGAGHADFDVVVAVNETKTPAQVAADMSKRRNQPSPQQAGELLARFREWGTKQFVYGALFLQRHPRADVPPWTTRLRLALETRGRDFTAQIAWHHRGEQADFPDWLARSRPRLSPALEVHVRHVVREGVLQPAEFIFTADRPFSFNTRMDGWVAPLVSRFDGHRTVAEIHAVARAENALPAGFELKDMIELAALLVERGYVVLD